MRGRFIVLEGPDGAGKSTNAQFIAQFLKVRGIDCINTYEVGGTPFGKKARDALFVKDPNEPMDKISILLTVMATRIQHLANVIRPALAKGQWVICDRYRYSTYVYQSMMQDISIERVRAFEELAFKDQPPIEPDDIFYFYADEQTLSIRSGKRGETNNDRFKLPSTFVKTVANYETVFSNEDYMRTIGLNRSLVRRINANESEQGVRAQLSEKLNYIINSHAMYNRIFDKDRQAQGVFTPGTSRHGSDRTALFGEGLPDSAVDIKPDEKGFRSVSNAEYEELRRHGKI
jgi:dTMP kinase